MTVCVPRAGARTVGSGPGPPALTPRSNPPSLLRQLSSIRLLSHCYCSNFNYLKTCKNILTLETERWYPRLHCVCELSDVQVRPCFCMGTSFCMENYFPSHWHTLMPSPSHTSWPQPANHPHPSPLPCSLGSHPLGSHPLTPPRFLLVPLLVPDQRGYLWMASGSSHSAGPLCGELGWALGSGGREWSQEWPCSCCCSWRNCGTISNSASELLWNWF